MAIRRTKRDKETAQAHRAEHQTYQFRSDAKVKSMGRSTPLSASDMISFDITLIKRDLLRTLIASVVVFGILCGLYFKLR